MTVSQYIAGYLENKGVSHVFELTGGMVSYLLDAIHQHSNIELISVRHEQAAGFAADAFARQKGIPGVAIATSGPGAINLLTGIGNCYYDSVPGVFITGQVNTYERKGESGMRQLGFQENDIVPMAIPITKKAFEVSRIEDIPKVLDEAFALSVSGRPGPVLIDIPMNFQRSEMEIVDSEERDYEFQKEPVIDFSVINEICEGIEKAERPLIIAGRGIRAANTLREFREFVEKSGIPVVSSLNGLDVLSYDHESRIGFIGVYGNRWANISTYRSDFILALGTRLDIRQTGADIDAFQENKKIFHVDIEESELKSRLGKSVAVHMNLKRFFAQMKNRMIEFPVLDFSAWIREISELRNRYPDTKELKIVGGINPNVFLHQLSKLSQRAIGYVSDVGNHQMWCAQSLELNSEQTFNTSGGMGAMGYALPAALGVSFADKRKPVVMISGDGGFQINIQELQTVVHHKLPLKMIIFNNQSLGMIRQFQDSYFEERHVSSEIGYSCPDFEKVATSYGIDANTISFDEQIDEALNMLWKDEEKPYLLQVMLDPKVNAYPKIEFGNPIHIMDPLVGDEG